MTSCFYWFWSWFQYKTQIDLIIHPWNLDSFQYKNSEWMLASLFELFIQHDNHYIYSIEISSPLKTTQYYDSHQLSEMIPFQSMVFKISRSPNTIHFRVLGTRPSTIQGPCKITINLWSSSPLLGHVLAMCTYRDDIYHIISIGDNEPLKSLYCI